MITFSLIVLLLTPAGQIDRYDFGPGLTREQCEAAAARARVQLPETLSEATVFSIDCIPTRGT